MLLPNEDDDSEVEVMVVIAPDVPTSLFLDETYIHRVLLNLLSNALKFTRSGYVMLTIEMVEKNLVAKVSDSGFGIPPSFLPQLFEPFTQAQTRGSQRGTGLGLSIVRKLLYKMQGTIEVESRHLDTAETGPEQTGTTFTVTLPMQVSWPAQINPEPIEETQTVAVFLSNKERSLEALNIAWGLYGNNVIVVEDFSELRNMQFKYIWVDTEYLEGNPECLRRLLHEVQWTILVSYSEQNALRRLGGLLSTPHFVPLQRPLMWHTFKGSIAIARQASTRNGLSKTVRFNSIPDFEDSQSITQVKGASTSKDVNILLVEDNPVSMNIFLTISN